MFDKGQYHVVSDELGINRPTPFLNEGQPTSWRTAMLLHGERIIDTFECAHRMVFVTNLRVAYFSSGITKRVLGDYPHDSVTKWVSTNFGGSQVFFPGGKESLWIQKDDLPRFHAALEGLVPNENRVPHSPKRRGWLSRLFG